MYYPNTSKSNCAKLFKHSQLCNAQCLTPDFCVSMMTSLKKMFGGLAAHQTKCAEQAANYNLFLNNNCLLFGLITGLPLNHKDVTDKAIHEAQPATLQLLHPNPLCNQSEAPIDAVEEESPGS